jgi:formylglycine-generating enzyme required for sulfatase activity
MFTHIAYNPEILGGAWDSVVYYLRASDRNRNNPDNINNNIGFRCARLLPLFSSARI